MRFRFPHGLGHEAVPLDLRERDGTRGIRNGRFHQGRCLRRVIHCRTTIVWAATISHCLMVEIGNQHCGRFHVENGIPGFFNLFQCGGIDGDGRFRWPTDGSAFRSGTSFAIAMKRNPTILCMNRPIVAEEEVASHERASAFHALERTLLGVYSPVSPYEQSSRKCGEWWSWKEITATRGLLASGQRGECWPDTEG